MQNNRATQLTFEGAGWPAPSPATEEKDVDEQKIYTFGTQRRKLNNLAFLAGKHDAVVLDVRARAASRVAEWNKGAMQRTLGARYRHVKEFGNVNYKEHDAPIELADPEAGVDIVREIMGAGKSVILLCYEEKPADCHRSIVATLLAEKLGFPVEHLLRE